MVLHTPSSIKANRGFIVGSLLLLLLLMALLAVSVFLLRTNAVVQKKFDGKKWELPAKVYARPLEIYPGAYIARSTLLEELRLLGYQQRNNYSVVGSYFDNGSELIVHTRQVHAGDVQSAAQIVKIKFDLATITQVETNLANPQARVMLEPLLIGGIYPSHNEDRELIRYDDVPRAFIDTLLATEDRKFFYHMGVSPKAIMRAVVAKVRGGRAQGGSTITQQLVKNFYLTPDRHIKRKVNEMVMAVLLELTHSKQEILEAYINEVNLGQAGPQSVNGFALGSRYFFDVPLPELKLSQMALLVAVINGPSMYNPWRNPKDALARRNLVINNLLVVGKITAEQAQAAQAAPLGIVAKPQISDVKYPEFLDMVKRDLKASYNANELESEGLHIYTSLDPIVQANTKAQFMATVRSLKSASKLQGAALVADPHSGELQAVVGSTTSFTGFNRAIDAKRQVGSLLKPVVYLNALTSGRYTVASVVNDGEISLEVKNDKGPELWQPSNYDGVFHGEVPMYKALANSYNAAAVNVGNEIGVNAFVSRLKSLGLDGDYNYYPSLFLGAVDFSPMDMLGLYQVFAAGGQRHQLHTIRYITDANEQVIDKFNDSSQQVVASSQAYLLNYLLQQVFNQGTAQSAYASLPSSLALAGKTGTTNDLRDSWFAGYSGNRVAVVWLGADKNTAIGLSGSNGALPVWVNIMKALPQKPVLFNLPLEVQWHWLDGLTGVLSAQECADSVQVPLLVETIPTDIGECAFAVRQLEDPLQFEQNGFDSEFGGALGEGDTLPSMDGFGADDLADEPPSNRFNSAP